MHRRFSWIIAALVLVSCTEDFDQYFVAGGGAGAGAAGGGGSAAGGAPSGGAGGSASGGAPQGGAPQGGAPQGGGPQGGAPQGGAGGGETGGSGGSGGNPTTFNLPCSTETPPTLTCLGPEEICCDKQNGTLDCDPTCNPANSIVIECRVPADCGDGQVCCAVLTGDTGKVSCVPGSECVGSLNLVMCEDNTNACDDPETCQFVDVMPPGYFACQP